MLFIGFFVIDFFIFSVAICVVVNVPCLYVWLYWLSSVSSDHQEQYHFACYAIGISCIIELCAEAPLFISQVFCFVRLKIAINTLHIFVRSIIFLWIVFNDGTLAIWAFAIAQLCSAAVILFCYYAFFIYYIQKFNTYRSELISENRIQREKSKVPALFENMHDFPFHKCTELLPNILPRKKVNKILSIHLSIRFTLY